MKIISVLGELTDIPAKKQPLSSAPFSCAGVQGVPRHTGTEMRAVSDAGAVSYLNRMTVPVIGNESFTTLLLELSRPLHHPKWQRVNACGVPRRIGRSYVRACSH